MSGKKLSIFVPIKKIDEEQRLVYGTVAAEVVDNSGEMFDYEGSKPHFEKWSENAFATSGGKSHGNLRVMHTSKVAGIIASPLGFDDESRTIEACAKVVDDDEWKKVQTGCYTGFSMGGRYVSRAEKSDGVKTYVAEPCEISLVDKPCIPTATFSVIKADGIVEEHRFRDDLYEKADNMLREPTNDEMLPVAKSLAKAAGQPEDSWLHFMDAAREQLLKADDAGGGGQQQTEIPAESGPDGEAPVQPDEADANKADKPFTPKKDGEEEEEKADGGADAGAKNTAEEDEEGEEEEDEAEKSDTPELQQGWQARDGSFHLSKKAARAHNKALAKVDEPSLADSLRELSATAEAVIKGEIPEADTGTEENEAAVTKAADVLAAIDAPLQQFKAFRDSDALAKSMYNVSRLADIICSLEGLHCSMVCWNDEAPSPAAGDVLGHLKGLGDTLVQMATEEVKELVARGGKRAGVEMVLADDSIVELAASTLGLEKATLVDELQKRDPGQDADYLAKLDEANKRADDAVAKADAATTQLAELEPLVKTLQAQFEDIKKLPLPKAPTTSALGKGEVVEDKGGGAIDLSKADPSALADAAIRLAHTRPVHVQLPGNSG